jgi:hypothetical protein
VSFGAQEAHNFIVKDSKCSASIWFGAIGWREYMSTAKIYKRWQFWVILWLIITAVNLYRRATKPLVSGGNPPIIEFDGLRAQLYVIGPYTLEQLKQEYKQEYKITGGENISTAEQQKELEKTRGDKNYDIWQLDPGSLSRGFGVSITYGIAPDGFRQVYPANGKSPEALIEGKVYAVVAPSADTADVKSEYFMIDNGTAVIIPPGKITDK